MTQQEASVLQTANRGLPQGWEAVYIEEGGQKVMRYLNGSVLQQERPANGVTNKRVIPIAGANPALNPVVVRNMALFVERPARDAEILQGLERRLAE